MILQQGDVLLKRIDKLPSGLKPLDSKVIQEGETTGHKHQFSKGSNVRIFIHDDGTVDMARITPAEKKYLVVEGDSVALLRHEEHNPITVEPGVYKIDIVREWDYDKMEAERVVD